MTPFFAGIATGKDGTDREKPETFGTMARSATTRASREIGYDAETEVCSRLVRIGHSYDIPWRLERSMRYFCGSQTVARVDKPLTKGVTLKTPTSGLTKPNEASLKAATNSNKKPDNQNPPKIGNQNWTKSQNQNQPKPGNQDKAKTNKRGQSIPEQGDCLVQCVQNFAKHAQRIVDELRAAIPIPKSAEQENPAVASGILDSLLFLTTNVGLKWMA